MNTGRKTINVTFPKLVQGGFGKGFFSKGYHVPFGTKGTHFGEYRTENSFGPQKNPKGGQFRK